MSIALFARMSSSRGLRFGVASTLCCASLLAIAAVESYSWLGLPVSFQAKEYVFNPWPALELRKVQLQTTQPMDIPHVWLKPDWNAWLTEFKTNRLRADVDEVVLTPSALARMGTSDGPSTRKITHVNFSRMKIKVGATTLELPEGKMDFGGDGTLTQVRVELEGKILVTLSPDKGNLHLAIQTERTTLPNLPAFIFDSVVAEGTIDDLGINLTKLGANGDGGSISGSLNINLAEADSAVLSGDLAFSSLRAKDILDRLYPRHVIDGELNANVKLQAKANSLAALKSAPIQIEGNYTLKRGSIDHFGLLEGIRQASPGVVGSGMSRFESITGKFSGGTGAKASVSFGGLHNGALTGSGNFTVAPDGVLAGIIAGTLSLPDGQTLSNRFALSGRASAPVMRR
ncbi:AsmA-like C-terminal region-containing protein [Uliginosibacterium gangwonense]|uniref:AsmA-like C-terminal region-containing protein n=1 Tax=Uliginosibacterium gangwonense TaxID=392736 RepID=UPI0003A13C28|nr:AsmA-like C-terminal region-containing protein [Uliginosibacterium gangwonense]